MTLENRRQAFDDTRRGLLDELEALDPALLVAKPIAGKWSIIEIVEHPSSGPLTASQAVRMGQVHVDGHVRQIRGRRRLLA